MVVDTDPRPDPTERPPTLSHADILRTLSRLDGLAAARWPGLTRTERAAAMGLATELRDVLRRYEISLRVVEIRAHQAREGA